MVTIIDRSYINRMGDAEHWFIDTYHSGLNSNFEKDRVVKEHVGCELLLMKLFDEARVASLETLERNYVISTWVSSMNYSKKTIMEKVSSWYHDVKRNQRMHVRSNLSMHRFHRT